MNCTGQGPAGSPGPRCTRLWEERRDPHDIGEVQPKDPAWRFRALADASGDVELVQTWASEYEVAGVVVARGKAGPQNAVRRENLNGCDTIHSRRKNVWSISGRAEILHPKVFRKSAISSGVSVLSRSPRSRKWSLAVSSSSSARSAASLSVLPRQMEP